MKFTRRSMFILAAATMLASAAPAMADLKVAVDAGPYPPFASPDPSGKWVGWEIDVMEALCAEMKEKCEVTPTAWDGIIAALQSKQIDMIFASMSINAERKKSIDFSNMYYNTPTWLIGPKNGDMDITPAHLSGKTIGVQVSTIHQRYVDKYFAPAGAVIKTYQTQDEVNQDLAAGRLDYVQADGASLDAFLKTDQGKACCESKGKVPDDPAILGEGVGAGIRKEDTALKDKVNAAISALAKSGKFTEITAKYPDLVPIMVNPTE